MKFGVRKVNVKTRVKARTTGKLKREAKKAINPLYGKKGMGLVNDPEKALYNKIYSNTTISADELLDCDNIENYNNDDEIQIFKVNDGEKRESNIFKNILNGFFIFIGFLLIIYSFEKNNIAITLLGALGLYKGIKYFINKHKKEL